MTSNYGNPCPIFKSPYINNCNYSTAYHILQHIYKDIKTADVGESIKENVRLYNIVTMEYYDAMYIATRF